MAEPGLKITVDEFARRTVGPTNAGDRARIPVDDGGYLPVSDFIPVNPGPADRRGAPCADDVALRAEPGHGRREEGELARAQPLGRDGFSSGVLDPVSGPAHLGRQNDDVRSRPRACIDDVERLPASRRGLALVEIDG